MKTTILNDLYKIEKENPGFTFEVIANEIILTTDLYHDYIVENYMNSTKKLNHNFIVANMVDEFDADIEDAGKEEWEKDSRSYREWLIIAK